MFKNGKLRPREGRVFPNIPEQVKVRKLEASLLIAVYSLFILGTPLAATHLRQADMLAGLELA